MVAPARGVALAVCLACALAVPRHAAAAPPPCDQHTCDRLAGTIRTAGERAPVEGARVFVLPAQPGARPGRVVSPVLDEAEPAWFRTAQTDAQGRFELEGVPEGPVRLAIVHEGFDRQEWIVSVPGRRAAGLALYLRPRAHDPYRTVVEDALPPMEIPAPSERSLTREEVDTVPGSQGDVLRSLQNMPGVTRSAGGFGELILRGSGPGQTSVYAGTQRIPRAFHFPGIASVLSSGSVEKVELVPSNYDVAYGNGTGGLVRIVPRRGRSDGHHGYAELDLGGVGGLVEGPVGKRGWTYLAGAQRSHVDLIVRAVREVDPSAVISEPQYYDYQAFFDRQRGGRELGIHFIGSWDRLLTRDPYQPDGAPAFELRAGFQRLDVTARRRIDDWVFLISPGLRLDTGFNTQNAGDWQATRRDYIGTVRAEIQRTVGRGHLIRVGTETELDAFAWRTRAPTFDPDGFANAHRIERAHGLETAIAVFASSALALGDLTLTPGVRYSVFTLGSQSVSATDPRLAARWQATPKVRWSAGLGMYSGPFDTGSAVSPGIVDQEHETPGGGQVVVPASIRNVFNRAVRVDTTDVYLSRALQTSNAIAFDLPHDLALELTGFVRRRQTQLPPLFGNGYPRAEWITWSYGLEALLRRELARNLYGWIGYTLMWARDIRPEQLGYSRRAEAGDYDQRHNLVLVASYALPRNWRIGVRFRYATGLPYTPVVGSWAFAYGGQTGHQALFGVPQSARFPDFHQLDLRIDKRFYGRYASVLTYLDVQNVYNRANTEVFVYSPDYSKKIGAIGLPIFPTLGLRVEF